VAKNAITWFSIPTNNFDRAVKFYSTILGEAIQVHDFMGKKLGLFPMDQTPGLVGGALETPDPKLKVSDQGTRVFLNCEGKLDQVAGRVEKAGGKIIQPKFSIGEEGQIVLIRDSEGNTVGLHSH
jgi:uncharacterized protein